MNRTARRWTRWIPWALLVAWAGLVSFGLATAPGPPVDFATYADAARRLAETGSPYAPTEDSLARWRTMHAVLVDGAGPPGEVPTIPGPYLYPPSLALLIADTGLPSAPWIAVLAAALVATVLVWLRAAPVASPWWLLLVVLSWDVLASLSGGNAELLLIALSLAACLAFHRGSGLAAGALAAPVLLVKPFFGLLYLSFALIAVRTEGAAALRRTAVALATAAALVALEVLRWPPELRDTALAFLTSAAEASYLALPSAEWRPLSDWNRAPVQVFATLGLSPGAAQAAALALWAALTAGALALLPRRAPDFAAAFALAWTLFLVARPMTVALPFLELFVVTALWPRLAPGRPRRLLLGGAVLLMAAHWAALVLSIAGAGPFAFTLQTAALPWETLLVLPAALALALTSARRAAAEHSP